MEIRQAALKCLIKILEHRDSYEETLDFYARRVDSPADLTNTIAGAIRHKLTLDFFIEKISDRKVPKLSMTVRNILRLGIFELEYLERPEYAVVNSYVELCRKHEKKAFNFVNAVLRNFIRKRASIIIKDNDLSIKYSHPAWLVNKWIKTYGKEATEKILEYNNRPPVISLRINRIKTTKAAFEQLLKQNEIEFKQSKFCEDCLIIEHKGNIKNIPGYDEGFWVVQGESSAMAAPALDCKEGQKILDLCAAPGSKTTHIASIINNKGEITAVDVSAERLERVKQNCSRLGITCVKTTSADALELRFNEEFDRILIDAPCSNTGVLGKRPDARWNRQPDDIKNLAELQLKIINNAANMLKSGGTMVYSTCSIEPEENTEVIEKFLQTHPEFSLVNANQILQSESNIDGFFIAVLEKI